MGDPGESRVHDVQGKVKWFDPKKGFGFIARDNDADVFAHYSAIVGDGFRILKDGWVVTYDAERRDRGWHATRIVVPPDKLRDLAANQPESKPDSDIELKPGGPQGNPGGSDSSIVTKTPQQRTPPSEPRR